MNCNYLLRVEIVKIFSIIAPFHNKFHNNLYFSDFDKNNYEMNWQEEFQLMDFHLLFNCNICIFIFIN